MSLLIKFTIKNKHATQETCMAAILIALNTNILQLDYSTIRVLLFLKCNLSPDLLVTWWRNAQLMLNGRKHVCTNDLCLSFVFELKINAIFVQIKWIAFAGRGFKICQWKKSITTLWGTLHINILHANTHTYTMTQEGCCDIFAAIMQPPEVSLSLQLQHLIKIWTR